MTADSFRTLLSALAGSYCAGELSHAEYLAERAEVWSGIRACGLGAEVLAGWVA